MVKLWLNIMDFSGFRCWSTLTTSIDTVLMMLKLQLMVAEQLKVCILMIDDRC